MRDATFATPHRPSPGRFLLAGLLLLLCSGRACAVDIEALVGFGASPRLPARYRPDTWTPITIYLGGQGVNGVGQLQLSTRIGDRTTVYTRRVTLHDGPLNEIQSFVFLPRFANDWRGMPTNTGNVDITVQLLVDGRKIADKTLVLPMMLSPETYNILALTSDGSGLNFLLKKKLGLIHRHVNPATLGYLNNMGGGNNNNNITQLTSSSVVYADPRALPAMGQGYDAIDAIALADLALDTLTEDQQAAMKEYVRRGGLLIVSGGGDLARIKGQFLQDLLPVQPTGTVTAQTFPDLEQRYGQPFMTTKRETNLLTDGVLKPDARALFGHTPGRLPLVSARSYGSGVVVFTAFDFLAPEFRAWKGAPALWRDLLRSGNNALSPRDLLAANHAAYYGSYQSSSLSDALAGTQATNTPAISTVLLFLGAYLFLLIPVSYYLLKRLDKRELAWVTAPLLIIGFTVVSYVIAQSIKGRLLLVNRAVVLEGSANSDQVAGFGQMTLYSPGRAYYNLAFSGPDAENTDYRAAVPNEISTSSSDMGGTLTVEHDKTTILRDVMVKLWDKRSFATPVFAQLGGPIAVKTTALGGDRVRVSITNRTRYALKDCALINGGSPITLGDLAPGESAEKTVNWNHSAGGMVLGLPQPSYSDNPNDTQNATRHKIQSGVISLLDSNQNNQQYYGEVDLPFGQGVNAFAGWFYDPLLEVQVNGQKPAGEEVNLLFVHLPAPQEMQARFQGAGNPFLAPAQRNLEDEETSGYRPSGGSRQGVFK